MIYHTNAFSENAFSYDPNLTSRVSSGDTTLAEYGHLADGTKIRSVDGAGNGFQYRGSLVYAQTAGRSVPPTLTLDCALTTAGRIVRGTAADGSVSYSSLIHLRDHLGSVRAVVDGDTGTVIEANDYLDSCKVQVYVSNQLQSAFVWYDGDVYGEYLEPVEKHKTTQLGNLLSKLLRTTDQSMTASQ